MITPRQLKILTAIVEDYVDLGQPIGSNTLIQRHNVDVSPATIRNDMKTLEENSLITKTHFSSGRIPSEAGFRLYANHLLEQPCNFEMQGSLDIHQMLVNHHYDLSSTLDTFAKVFSNQAHYTTLVIGPDHSKASILDVHLMKLNPHHLIVVMIDETGQVKHLHVTSDQPYADHSIIKVSNYLSANVRQFFDGNDVQSIEVYRMLGFNAEEADLIVRILHMLHQYRNNQSTRVYLGGKHQLIEGLNESTVASIQPILKYIESDRIADVIHHMSDQLINVRIGTDIEQNLHGIAILSRSYQIDKDLTGHIAVIGPTAMHYHNVIQLLSRIS
ncbi:TPA: heat-inducible transcription repressor HrcA [Staphylococcus pseudintermedius]|nr:heat-inducible transcription repressor HrcA [Staphylococcus pseudintermedius]HAR6293089.1 heat-inducible transcription repressor HrcA [Staphylococcus pseudintermedius]